MPVREREKVRSRASDSRRTFAKGEGSAAGTGEEECQSRSYSFVGGGGGGKRGKGKPTVARALEDSDSVSVSVSSAGTGGERDREAGLAERLNKRIVSKPPCSFEGKWTFFGMEWGEEGPVLLKKGEAGAERARVWFERWEQGMFGEEGEDLREDFKGLPFERRIVGVEEDLEGNGMVCCDIERFNLKELF